MRLQSLHIAPALAAALLFGAVGVAHAEPVCVFDSTTNQRLYMAPERATTLFAIERFSPCTDASHPSGENTVTWRGLISLTGPNIQCESTPRRSMLLSCTTDLLPRGSGGALEIYDLDAIARRYYRHDLNDYLDGQDHLHLCHSGGWSDVEVDGQVMMVTAPAARGTIVGWELRGIFPNCPNDAPHAVVLWGADVPLGDYGVFVVVIGVGYVDDIPVIAAELSDDIVTLIDSIVDLSNSPTQ